MRRMATPKPSIYISKYFTDHDALFLPSWGVHHVPDEIEKNNIWKMAKKMDLIRGIMGRPIKIHCWIRPFCVDAKNTEYDGKDYNAFIGGALHSAHTVGLAVDWDCTGLDCDVARTKLKPYLEGLEIRMEDKQKSSWIHTDLYPPRPNRFFKP